MLFQQFFDPESSTCSYLLARRRGGEALLIDPVRGRAMHYLAVLDDWQSRLVLAVDTHTHADHITGLGELRGATGCASAMGERSRAECLSWKFRDGQRLDVDGLAITARHTPGHTDDSYSLLMRDRAFTGDLLLIGATGRTDLQDGDAGTAYDSLFGCLLRLSDATLVFPAHDYGGRRSSTIGAERRDNPRLQVGSREEYMVQMAALRLAPPRLIDVAPALNRRCGEELPPA